MITLFDNGTYVIKKLRDREIYHVYVRIGEAVVILCAGLYSFEDALEVIG